MDPFDGLVRITGEKPLISSGNVMEQGLADIPEIVRKSEEI